MTRKQKRSAVIFGALGVLAVAVALVLTALSEQVTFFRTPSDLVNVAPGESGRVRLGGVVVEGSVDNSLEDAVIFAVEDANAALKVRYAGILPDLFREGQGIVAEGVLGKDGTFTADTVLAKHDETYMPREVADSLKEQGYWKGTEAQ
ncbi:cytochrome c maturation protein CcmE [Ahrensia marina]|uniref:Cytochrome c-type biogenesis protein CcmE n=1 Tax=Ahrensia marina TaxID=1514904 RepID=A0A0M9GNU6_9HYPH|nr:cytochrome c maturation protein CcmE [Ahrensia marina]KPB02287.1 cytochrome C biogenesis protein CcmE [Ahrensia marina]